MSHSDNNLGRSGRNHRPAIIAIVVALAVAAVAYFVFLPGTNEQNEGIATTPPPADAPLGEAGGTDGTTSTPVSPEGAAPVGELPATEMPAADAAATGEPAAPGN